MDPFSFVLLGLIGVLGVSAVATAVRGRRPDARWGEVLRRLALQPQLLIAEPSGWSTSPPPGRVSVTFVSDDESRARLGTPDHVGQASVVLRCAQGGDGSYQLLAQARWLLADGPVFAVAPEGIWESVRTERGVPDVVLGHRVFDANFSVRSRDERVKACYTPALCELHALRLPQLSIQSGRQLLDGRCRLESQRVDELASQVQDVLQLVAQLASADVFGLGALRSLEGAVLAPDGTPRVSLGSLPVTLGPVLERRARTRAWCERPGRAEVRALEITAAAPTQGALARRLGPEAAQALASVGEGTLASGASGVSFTWSGVEVDPRRLAAGARLVELLAEPPRTGVYR